MATGTPHSHDAVNLDPDVLHRLLQLKKFERPYKRDYFPKEWFPGDGWGGAIRALHHIGACASLETVSLSLGDRGSASDLRALHHGLKQQVEAPQWRTLDLTWNQGLLASDEACEELLAILRLCTNLEVLNLYRTGLNASGLAIIAQGYGQGLESGASEMRALLHHGLKQQVEAPQWRTLDLSHNRNLLESDEACEELFAILRLCTDLEELNISATDLKASGLAILVRGMSLTALQHHGAQEQQAAATHDWPQWRTLNLEWNWELLASNEAGEQMLDILRICTKLEELDIRGTGLEASGLATLTRGLCSSGHRSLNMVPFVSGNDAVWKGEWADYMADLLEAPPLNITQLNTGYYEYGGYSRTGLDRLCGVLRTNTRLHELEIRAQHCILLEALYPAQGRPTFNTSITRLQCKSSYSSWGKALQQLTAVVAQNNAVTDLTIMETQYFMAMVSMATWRSFSQALRINTTIHHLTISGGYNKTRDSVCAEVLNVLKVNLTLRAVVVENPSMQAAIDLKLEENAEKRSAAFLKAMKQARPHCARLFLCGSPYAGKTALRKSLVNCVKSRKGRLSGKVVCKVAEIGESMVDVRRTRGVEVHTLFHGSNMRVTVWDIAGHEEFHALHGIIFPSVNPAYMFAFLFNVLPPSKDANKSSDPSKNNVLYEDFKTRLQDGLRYWLLFVASNMNRDAGILPKMLVILTHVDKVKIPTIATLENWAIDVLQQLRADFADHVDVCQKVHVVKANSYKQVQTVLDDVEENFKVLLSEKLGQTVPQPCAEIIHLLQVWKKKHPSQPIITREKFKTLQLKATSIKTMSSELEVDKMAERMQHISTYLHDVGEIIVFKDLDFIVVDPHWFGQDILGRMIEFEGKSILGTTPTGFVHKKQLDELLKLSIPLGGVQLEDTSLDHLVNFLGKLMMKFDLCYEKAPGNMDHGFFVPTTLGKSTFKGDPEDGTRELTWSGGGDVYVGRRLQCHDPRRTFLTPSLFPRLQVHLHGEELLWSGNPIYKLEINLIYIMIGGMEVFVELSRSDKYETSIDILMKSNVSLERTMEFLHTHLVNKICDFTSLVCRQVSLVQGIIRPECVEKLTMSAHREKQSILVDELKRALKASPHFPNYIHTWEHHCEGLDRASDEAYGLLGPSELNDIHAERLEDLGGVAIDVETPKGLHANAQHGIGLPGSKSLLGTSSQHAGDRYPNTNVEAGGRRGLALIVSVEKDRPGGQVDRGRLEVLAKALFFDTKIIVDPSDVGKLRNDIKEIAESSDLAKDDGFLWCINAHGEVGEDGMHYIGISNGKMCVDEDILEPFTTSKHLANKPKVFLINACRGIGHLVNDDQCLHVDKCFTYGEPRPLYSVRDYLVAFSTSHGDESFRRAQSGTHFVKALVDLGVEAFSTTDVDRIMTRVIDKVTTMEVKLKNKEGKLEPRFQCPEIRRTLAKDLYWRPDRLKLEYN